jgi:thymidylate synthase (FAD)
VLSVRRRFRDLEPEHPVEPARLGHVLRHESDRLEPAAHGANVPGSTGPLARLAAVTVTSEVIAENTIRVLDHGFVRLDDAMADDLSVVNGARVSFARRKDVMDESDEGLIRFLMRDRHGTPFEHNAFRFHVRAPIFVAREWFRHRVGSFNEFSMRYARATEDFYVPEAEDVRSQVGKPGSYSFEPVDAELAEAARDELKAVYEAAYEAYERLVEQGVARELARAVLPVGAYTEFYWTVNARALMNFISLRAAETAQREIRRYAEACERFFAERMPVTHAAFVTSGRVAP